mmetsp:Transcript_19022/g.16857  ORF Transcript_19022/g.16857 Transcript_19022/m.16857 type:complete len:145 (+) Transcript_19022:35-469(+)
MWKKRIQQQNNFNDEDNFEENEVPMRQTKNIFNKESKGMIDSLTPFFGDEKRRRKEKSEESEEFHLRGEIDNKLEENFSTELEQEEDHEISIHGILRRYKDNKELLNEKEFNYICHHLNIDNPESYDDVLYSYLSKIASDLNKL